MTSTHPVAPLIQLIANRLWRFRPRRDIDGWPTSVNIEVSFAGTSVVLSLSSESKFRHDTQRVLSALCASVAGSNRSDHEVRSVDLWDVADYTEQVAAVVRLAETLRGPKGPL